MQAINGCAFCRANRKPWTNHTANSCVDLANCVCGYCKKKGHTPKKCPKSALKKQRDEEWAKRQEQRKGETETQKKTWSTIVVNSLTAEEREVMEQQHRKNQQRKAEEKRKQYEERKKRREEAAIRAEQSYVRKMRNQYGIKACDFAQQGDFWFFFVEGRKEDSNMAKVLRQNPENQLRFKDYLQEKYFVNWLSRSENTEDDCQILEQWRWEQEQWEYEQEKREKAELGVYIKEEEELCKAMKEKLEKGEITQPEYDDWKWQKDFDDELAFEREGEIMLNAHQRHETNYEAWKRRRTEHQV